MPSGPKSLAKMPIDKPDIVADGFAVVPCPDNVVPSVKSPFMPVAPDPN